MIGNALSRLNATGAQGPNELMQLLAVQNAQRQAQQQQAAQSVMNPFASMMQNVGQHVSQPTSLAGMGMNQVGNAQSQEKDALDTYKQTVQRKPKAAVNSGQGNTALGIGALLMLLGARPQDVLGAGQTYFGGLANKAQQDREQEMQAAELEYRGKMQEAGATREKARMLMDESRYRAGETKDNVRYNRNVLLQDQAIATEKDDKLFGRNRTRALDAKEQARYDAGITYRNQRDEYQDKRDTKQDARYYEEKIMSEDTPYWAIPNLVAGYRKAGGSIDPAITAQITAAAKTRYQQGQKANQLRLEGMLQDKTLKGQQITENNKRLSFLDEELKDAQRLRGLGIEKSVFEYHQSIQAAAKALASGDGKALTTANEQSFERVQKIINSLDSRYDSLRKQYEDLGNGKNTEAGQALKKEMDAVTTRMNTYQSQQDSLMGIGANAQGGAGTPPFSVSPTTNNGGAAIQLGNSVVRLGVPYKWGGTDKDKGIDCSALTQCIYAENGVKIPRTAIQQWRDPKLARVNTPAVGDLVFFDTGVNRTKDRYAKDANGYVTHVAVYVGDGYVLQSGSKRGTSKVPLSQFKNILGYKRPVA